mmetsp:Transcript_12576/g.38447  ORF Transcript_12576/g.38447 Transcript_12576/m.38447 type:complete len:130 (-) Transcript_12576:2193-2582(-)
MNEHKRLVEELKQASLRCRQLEVEIKRLSDESSAMKRHVQALAAENQILKRERSAAHNSDRRSVSASHAPASLGMQHLSENTSKQGGRAGIWARYPNLRGNHTKTSYKPIVDWNQKEYGNAAASYAVAQ